MKLTGISRHGAAVLGLVLLAACGGAATPAPAEPDPSLEEPESERGPVVAASSPKVRQGMDAIQAQDFAKAKVLLADARAAAPKDAQAAFYLGVALQSLGETAEAGKEYRAALELDPTLADASVNLSAMLLDENAADKALPVIDSGLQRAPKHPDLLLNRALALEAAGNKDEAVKAYGAAVAARPGNVELRLAYADLLLASGQSAPALEQVKKAAETDDPKLLAAAAHLFGRLKAPAECIGALDRALKPQPTAELHTRRGVCRHEAGDDPGAKADFDSALKLDPNFAPAHFYLGMHLRTANKKSALEHLKKASELSKGQGMAKAADEAIAELSKKKK
jgi:Tfp pilus assembly protein PilF